METESELHENIELTFSYQGEDLLWRGDIEVTEEIERGDYDTPDYSEVTCKVVSTETLERWNEEANDWEAVEVTPSIIWEIELNYERTL
jgi:hypothetical protein